MSNEYEQKANAVHFDKFFQGKVYIWADKGHTYTKNSQGVMTCTSMEAWQDINIITPKGWAKKNVKLIRPKRPIISASPSLNIPDEELQAFAEKISKFIPELNDEQKAQVIKSELYMGSTARNNPAFLTARQLFEVSKALKHPIKRYNLIVIDEKGTYFNSQDNLYDTTCIMKVKSVMKQYPTNTENWNTLWITTANKSSENTDNVGFVCVMNVGPKFRDLDPFQYATWSYSK